MMQAGHPNNSSDLPWGSAWGDRSGAGKNEGQRFYLALALMLVLFLPPALLIPSLNLPEPEGHTVEAIPPQLARLIKKPLPLAPDPVPIPKPEPEPSKSEPVQQTPAEVVESPEPLTSPPEPTPVQTVEKARAKASRSGLLAMKASLADLRSSESRTRQTLTANVDGSQVQPARDSAGQDSNQALAGSGGVEAPQDLPRRAVALADHEVRRVNVVEETLENTALEPTPYRVASAEPSTRSMRNIKQVFNANKTSLTAIVGREQRKDPLLHGKILLKLVIEPDGSVSRCEVVESELEHPQLEQRIAMRVRLFNFGAADVEQRELKFPLDFLPG